jgi:hypothetical protein
MLLTVQFIEMAREQGNKNKKKIIAKSFQIQIAEHNKKINHKSFQCFMPVPARRREHSKNKENLGFWIDEQNVYPKKNYIYRNNTPVNMRSL